MERISVSHEGEKGMKGTTHVKSPVASLCFDCSSVRKRVRVTISVFIFSPPTGATSPLEPLVVAIVKVEIG